MKLVCHMKTKTAAPLEADTVMGNVTLFLNNEKIKENEIVTADGAERISLSWWCRADHKKVFSYPDVTENKRSEYHSVILTCKVRGLRLCSKFNERV